MRRAAHPVAGGDVGRLAGAALLVVSVVWHRKRYPPYGAGAPDKCPAACLFLYQRNRRQRKVFGTPNSHLSVLRYCRAIPRAVACGVRLQSQVALHRLRSSNAPRSVIFELRGRAQKLPSLLATPPLPSPRGETSFCSAVRQKEQKRIRFL